MLLFINEECKMRQEKEKLFHDLCEKGELESVKTLLAEDPSLISSEWDMYGNGILYKYLDLVQRSYF